MPFLKEDNIGKISFISSAILVVLLTSILGSIFLHDQNRHFQQDLQRMERNFLQMQQERLRSEVELQISSIHAWRENSRNNLLENIRARTYEAYDIAENLYQKYEEKGPDKVKSLIREAIRPIRFNNGRGYFFIRDTRGPYVLYPPKPDLEGPDIVLLPHQDRDDVVQKMLNLLDRDGEGFISYQWPIPGGNDNELFEKNTFVKLFKPFDWIVGTGEYLVNFEAIVKQSIIDNLNSITPDERAPEYIFIYQLHDMAGGDEFATMLVNPNRPDLIDQKISDRYQDIKGNAFRKKMLQGIRTQGEAFVTYWYKNPGSEKQVSKLSYFKYYPKWNWIVAKGTSLEEVDRRIVGLQTDLQQARNNTIRNIVYYSLASGALFLLLGYVFSKGIHRIFAGYKRTQEKQQKELMRLNSALTVQAATDPLTLLHNRGYFNRHLEIEITRSARYGQALSLVIFDIDMFKDINDTFGHLAGDEILKELARLCQQNIRPSDILARWGGEEFVILAPEVDKKSLVAFAEKLRTLIENHSFSIATQITCSFGVTHHIEGESKDTFIGRGDEALYSAKREGRNRVVFR